MLRVMIEVKEKEKEKEKWSKNVCEVTSSISGLASKNEITSMAGAMGQLFGQLVKDTGLTSESIDAFYLKMKETLNADSNE